MLLTANTLPPHNPEKAGSSMLPAEMHLAYGPDLPETSKLQ